MITIKDLEERNNKYYFMEEFEDDNGYSSIGGIILFDNKSKRYHYELCYQVSDVEQWDSGSHITIEECLEDINSFQPDVDKLAYAMQCNS